MARRIETLGRYSGMHPINDSDKIRLMQISEETYQRIKRIGQNQRTLEKLSYDDIMGIVSDFYEKRK